jgi:prolyl-tRNA synthetase
MKDAYSFDTTDEGAMASYKKMYDAYMKIFARCGLKAFPVEADTGVIGGNYSHEFMVPAETGENEVAFCEACGYAANIEKATSGIPKTAAREIGAAIEKFATPGVVTIEALSKEPHKVPANRQIKTLVYMETIGDNTVPIIVLIRGDDYLNETKFAGFLGHAFRPATPQEVFEVMGAHPGSLGAVSVTLDSEISIYADERLRGANDMTTGANKDGFHFKNVSIERDIRVEEWKDLRTVTVGEPCVKCGKPLKIRRAIEVGHVFKLGITRTLQAIIEQGNDKDGVIWPLSVAPYTVCITPLSIAPESEVMKLAEKFYAELSAKNIDVILDDRDERPGVKFKDSELVGFPIRIGIGEKSLANW